LSTFNKPFYPCNTVTILQQGIVGNVFICTQFKLECRFSSSVNII
jgi:hypothetical protein